MACDKRKILAIIYAFVLYQSPYRIYLPLYLEVGMTPMFLEVSLCFVLSLLGFPEVNPLQKINVLYKLINLRNSPFLFRNI